MTATVKQSLIVAALSALLAGCAAQPAPRVQQVNVPVPVACQEMESPRPRGDRLRDGAGRGGAGRAQAAVSGASGRLTPQGRDRVGDRLRVEVAALRQGVDLVVVEQLWVGGRGGLPVRHRHLVGVGLGEGADCLIGRRDPGRRSGSERFRMSFPVVCGSE